MKSILSFAFLFCSFISNGQSSNDTVAGWDFPMDQSAEFPGGLVALRKFIAENLVYTPQMVGIEGKCFLQFVVNVNGSITHIKVKRGVPDCPDCDKAAIRVLEIMPPWISGEVAGKAIASYYNLPIVFKSQAN